MRVVVYDLPNGTQQRFEVFDEKEEQAERSVAEFALTSGDIVGYHFEGEYRLEGGHESED